jgi:hypothetical protein
LEIDPVCLVSDRCLLNIDMMVAMNCIGTILERRRRPSWPRRPRLSEAGSGKLRAAAAFARRRSFLGDQRGAVAFETLIVYLFMVTALLLPLADVAAAGFQFISGWEALRGFGQYVQYHSPPDVTNTSSWTSTLPATVAGYPINSVQVLCGNISAGAACTTTNVATSPIKYYSYTTTVTLAPLLLRSVLCPSSCTYTLPYSERFQ